MLVIVNGQVNTDGSSGIVVVIIPQEAAYPMVWPNVAGIWRLVMSGISNEYHDGTLYASGPWEADLTLPNPITQTAGTISTSWTNDEGKFNTLTGTITGNSIYFTLQTGVTDYWYFNGIINGSTISGTYSGRSSDDDPSCFPGGWCGIPTYKDSGTFRVTVTP